MVRKHARVSNDEGSSGRKRFRPYIWCDPCQKFTFLSRRFTACRFCSPGDCGNTSGNKAKEDMREGVVAKPSGGDGVLSAIRDLLAKDHQYGGMARVFDQLILEEQAEHASSDPPMPPKPSEEWMQRRAASNKAEKAVRHLEHQASLLAAAAAKAEAALTEAKEKLEANRLELEKAIVERTGAHSAMHKLSHPAPADFAVNLKKSKDKTPESEAPGDPMEQDEEQISGEHIPIPEDGEGETKAKTLASTLLAFAARPFRKEASASNASAAKPAEPDGQKHDKKATDRSNLVRELDEAEDSVAKRLKAEISEAEAAAEKCRIELVAKQEAAAQHLEAQRRAAEEARKAAEEEEKAKVSALGLSS